MDIGALKILHEPSLRHPTLLIGLRGWMDGGNVSSATLKYIVDRTNATPIGRVEPDCFYIYNFPGSMEIASLFRPATDIQDGVIRFLDMPSNRFYCSEEHDLLLFLGTEPHLHWSKYAACLFEICRRFGVERVYFIGSVAGLVPHTRQTRLSCVVSRDTLKDEIEKYGMRFTNYQGPSSIVTYLTHRATADQLAMITFVAEIPAYIQGHNARCVDEVLKLLSVMLDLNLDHEDLRMASEQFERRVSDLVSEHPELKDHIIKLEEAYDNEVFDSEMADVKNWLEQQGIRVD